ncbi:MAG TPA: carboxypeptidase-like regulatory domain-containing protein, partial [Acidobacteriota bacterium]|nr:carboxypeptidase-like regulatory domain-containing protein [Acidobacteriota bacterium]
PAGTVFTHTYLGPGTYNMTRIVYDTIMQQTTQSCSVTLSRFAIRGTVYKHDGVTPVPSATVKVVGTGYSKTLLSDANGFFAFANLKPGVYTLTIIKTGYTFPVVPPITVGPNSNASYPATTP